jgi:hypothetical protein
MEVAAAGDLAPAGEWLEERGAEAVYLPRLIAGVISGTLTGLFALGNQRNSSSLARALVRRSCLNCGVLVKLGP